MSFPTDTLADKGRRVYEALLVMFNRLKDPSLKLPSADLIAYQKEIDESVPLLESLARTKFRNPPEFQNLVNDDRAVLMGRLVKEIHQAVKSRVSTPEYSITMTNATRRARNKVTYVVYTILASVKDGNGKSFYFAIGDTGQYSFASEEYWEDIKN